MIIRILSQNLTNKNLMRETIIEEKKKYNIFQII